MSTIKRSSLLALIASVLQACLWIIESFGLHLPNLLFLIYPVIVSFGLVYFQGKSKLIPIGIFVTVSYGTLLLLRHASFWHLSFGAVFGALIVGSFLGGFCGFCFGAVVRKEAITKE